ncbi:MAG: histidinol-phosphate transaminase [Armatimonadetes bacterium]|nr:histidinol-phosphate transaminase [Armatimonadota bacterium]MDW8153686.1 histidinol-phosphate transaminase [Armatimonadota bacterium]
MREVRARPEIQALPEYRLRGQQGEVKLNQNELPYDLPEEIKREVVEALLERPWNRYPPMRAERLQALLAAMSGLREEQIVLANGSNEAILGLLQAFATSGVVVLPQPGYSMARPLAVVAGAEVREIPLRPDLTLDPEAVVAAARDAHMVFLASPNNPTGRAVPREGIAWIAARTEALVVVDEAYWGFFPDHARSLVGTPEYERHTAVGLLGEFPNLAVVRTASKAFGLAGARVGWVMGGRELSAILLRTLPPYNLDVFAQLAVEAVIRRPELVRSRIARVVAERERVFTELQAMGVRVYPSDANFLLFRCRDASAVFEYLAAQGILVRDVSHYPQLEGCLRVTIGTPEENDRFLHALRRCTGVAG